MLLSELFGGATFIISSTDAFDSLWREGCIFSQR